MTEANAERLLQFARAEIAAGVESCQVMGLGGARVTDGMVSLTPAPDARVEEVVEMRTERLASALFLEVAEGGIMVNFPPIMGQEPKLHGHSIYTDPRPVIAPTTALRDVYIKIAFSRSNATYAGDPDGPDVDEDHPAVNITVGSILGTAAVTVEVVPHGTSGVNVSPGSGSDREPYAGDYEWWWLLGTIQDLSIEMVANPSPASSLDAAFWGGVGFQTVASFGATEWEFSGAMSAP